MDTTRRLTLQKAVDACAQVTDNSWQQLLLVLLAVRSFYPDRSAVRLPVYIAVNRTTDIAALRKLLLELFSASRISTHAFGQTLRTPKSECVIEDLTTAPHGTFYWVRGCAYHRSLPAALQASGIPPSDENMAGDSIFIIPREFAADASAWGIVLDLGGVPK